MAETQLIPAPFATGIDEGQHPDYVHPGTQTTAINARFVKRGAIHKRFGYDHLTSNVVNGGTAISAAQRMLSFKGEIDLFDGKSLYSYSPATAAWQSKGPMTECSATWRPIASDVTTWTSGDCAYANGLICYGWLALDASGNAQPFATVVDSITGSNVLGPVQLDTATNNFFNLRVIATDQASSTVRFVVVYGDTATDIRAVVLDAAAPSSSLAWSSPAIITNHPYTAFDVCMVPHTSYFILALEGTTVGTHVNVYFFGTTSSFPFLGDVLLNETDSAMNGFAVYAASNNLAWVAYRRVADTKVNVGVFNPNTQTILHQPQTLMTPANNSHFISIGGVNSTTAVVCVYDGQEAFLRAQVDSTGALVAGSGPFTNYNIVPTGKPLTINGRTYMTSRYDRSTLDPCQMVLNINTDDTSALGKQSRCVARVAPRNANLSNLSPYAAISLVSIGGTRYATMGAQNSSAAGKPSIIGIVLDFAPKNVGLSAELGDSLYIAGGCPQQYDGSNVCELGYDNYPVVSLADNMTGVMGAGTYQYLVCYESWNERGEITRSSPSPVKKITIAGSHSVDVTIDYLNLTRRIGGLYASPPTQPPNVSIVIYRTLANQTTFFRQTPVSVLSANYNTANSLTVTINDDVPDSAIQSNAYGFIYSDGTSGQPVLNQCPPSLTTIVAHKNRLWGIAGDERTIWYTKTYTPNESANFADELTFTIEDTQRLTALVSLDDVLVVFSTDRIYLIAGDGALDNGQQSQIEGAVRVPSDVGCIDPRSVVVVPQGIMFQSTIGIYVLTRAHEVQYIGKAVEATLASYPVITDARLLPYANEVRFVARDVDDSSTIRHSVILVYNYLFSAWSVHHLDFAGASSPPSAPFPIVSAATAYDSNGALAYYCALVNGKIYVENRANFLDDGTWITLYVESAWLRLGDVQGYQKARRARFKGDYATAHRLTIQLSYNFNASTYPDSATFENDAALPGFLSLEDFGIHVGSGRGRSESVRISVRDQSPSNFGNRGTGQGATFIGLVAEVAARRGVYRPLPAQAKS